MREFLDRIEHALTIPAAEYVPAIGDVFTILDEARKALDQSALQQQEVPSEPVAFESATVEAIAREWDGCMAPMFDPAGNATDPIDIGATIREAFAASPSTTRQQEAGVNSYVVKAMLKESQIHAANPNDPWPSDRPAFTERKFLARQQEAGSGLSDEQILALATKADMLVNMGDGIYGPLPSGRAKILHFARALFAAAPSTPENAGGVSDGVDAHGEGQR